MQAPSDLAATSKFAELSVALGRPDEAAWALRKAIGIAPHLPDLRLRLANAEVRLGNFKAALAILDGLPVALRERFQVKLQRAGLLGQLGRRNEEIALYEELITSRPGDTRLLLNLGQAMGYVGRASEAAAIFLRAIKLKPALGEAWWSLANLKSFQFEKAHVRAMQQALETSASDEDKVHLRFALGSAFEQGGEADRAFANYDIGNQLRSTKIGRHQTRVTSFVSAAIETFDRPLLERHRGAGNPARDPIFIVGLQRSGSTLIEQILASHPLIEGTSELAIMQQLWAELDRAAAESGSNAFERLRKLDRAGIRQIGDAYLERSAAFRHSDKPHFIDKLPANWLNVGLIRLALPNATIIDARRHPMACGFSNFKQLYAGGVTYAYSLRTIGYFYRDYLRMMDHFDVVSPGAVCHVCNEALVENFEAEVRRLLDHVGIPFDPACLKFHENRRAVHTPSAQQVRRPVSREGLDAWRAFEPWLGPLKQALGPALDGWLPDHARA